MGVTADWSYPSDAAVWSEGHLRVLSRPEIGYVERAATAINTRGEIVGFASHRDQFQGATIPSPLIWSRRGKPRELSHDGMTYPTKINGSGEIVGHAKWGEFLGFYWNGKIWADRGYYATDINDRGWVVGESFDRGTAMLWRAGKAVELGDGIARDVNERGQIVGGGGKEGGDAFLWEKGNLEVLTVPGRQLRRGGGDQRARLGDRCGGRSPSSVAGKTRLLPRRRNPKSSRLEAIRLTAINDRGEILAIMDKSDEGRGALLQLVK